MVGKLHAGGASFRGAVAYCLGEARGPDWRGDGERAREAGTWPPPNAERVAWTETRNVATADPRTAARQMAATVQYAGELKRLGGIGAGGRKLEKPVVHYTLSWARDERPDRMEMSRAVDESLKVLGLEDRQAVVAAHRDGRHPHVHVVANRVSAEDGRAASLGRSRLELSRWAERWEREHGGIRCKRRAEHNRRRAAGERVVDRTAVADARYRRSEGGIERVRTGRWRPGRNVADAVLRRVHERQAWDEARGVLGDERDRADRCQREEWRELYRRQERERLGDPAGPGLEDRHRRERAALARDHGREARQLDADAARKYREAVESPIRAENLDSRAMADELARMERELPEADRGAFRRQMQLPAPGVTIAIERSRERDFDLSL